MAEVAGQVIEVTAQVGERVDAGDILLRLDSATLEAQRAQALAALQAAQAEAELLRVVAGDAEIEAARAAVAAAEAAYQRALAGPSANEITAAEARLRQADAAFKAAQAAYNRVAWNPAIATLPESLQLEQARLDLDAAQTAYDRLAGGADAATEAYAQLAAARAHLRRMEDGAEPAQIQAAEAQVRQAETALYLAQLQLDKATLRAPIPGIVAALHVAAGAMAAPNMPVARLISPAVQIVIAVDEASLALVHTGQSAAIEVDAYPGESFRGVVASVAPEVDSAAHTIPVTIRPTDGSMRLIPGMIATVRLSAK
jgi:multidrug resistance efflux pump